MQIAGASKRLPGIALLAIFAIGAWIWATPIYEAYVGFLSWVYAEVREFHKLLTESVGALADNPGWTTSAVLIGSSFVYGVLHAAGPGHGKVILTTYLFSQPEKIKKSIGLATISAIVQGIVAIVLVYGLFYVFGLVARDTKNAVLWSERLAFALVIVLGFALIWRGIRAVRLARPAHDHHEHHSHDHHHDDHHHHHDHDDAAVCSTCGHAHLPSNKQVDEARDWRTTLGVIFSIGLRPCTGAVLVLVFARFSGVTWAGVLAVLAMSLGTALTVSLLAITSVSARNLAFRLLGVTNSLSGRIGAAVSVLGGVVLVLMGLGLMTSSYAPPVRSMGL